MCVFPQDREKESKSGSGGTNWCEFMMVLGKLAMAEMNYYNLSFVGRTWIIMKKEVMADINSHMLLYMYMNTCMFVCFQV